METTEKGKYLPEDQDILDGLDSVEYDTSGIALEKRKAVISKLQIKAMLRSRKQIADNEESNKRFTIVLGAFALIQILIAGFGFALEAADSKNTALSVFLGVVFFMAVFWLIRKIDRMLGDK